MAVGSPVSFSGVRSEFGAGSSAMSSYVRGGGYVANHENNAAISSSASGLALSQFLNTDKDFDSLYGGNSGNYTYSLGSAYDGLSLAEVAAGYAGFGVFAAMGFALLPGSVGTIGSPNSFDYVGISQSSLSTSAIRGVFEWETGSDPFITPFNVSLALDGNTTGFTWSTLYIDGPGGTGGVYGRPGSGTYVGLYNLTYYTWFGSASGLYGDFRVQLVL